MGVACPLPALRQLEEELATTTRTGGHPLSCQRVLLGACLVFSLGGRASATDLRQQAVRSHRFEITLAPKDTTSHDARTADLFITRRKGDSWRMVGSCRVQETDNGPRFVRWVQVPSDGVYYFRSRAGDDAGKPQPPAPADPPEACVIVDTTQPVVRLVRPRGHETVATGEVMPITWQAADENFGDQPIRLAYSTDRGRSWTTIHQATKNDGEKNWTVPATKSRRLWIQVTARDKAGNVASATTSRPVRVTPVGDDRPPRPSRARADSAAPQPFPWMDANDANLGRYKWESYTEAYDAYTNYIYAGNLVRQGRLKDSLRYYRAAVEHDESFGEAWNDLAQVYKELAAFDKADRCIQKALAVDAHNPVYHHTAGEIHQARSFHLFRDALDDQDLAKAVQAKHNALKNYNRAIQEAERQRRLAQCAGTYFRIGEICYFLNQDAVGARMYWSKVLSFHTPTPSLDDVMHREGTPAEEDARDTYERYTEMKVDLRTWQQWARAYLRQLDAMEEQGLLQPAPRGGRPQARELRPAPGPLEEHPGRPAERPPQGRGAYLQPDYGSRPPVGGQSSPAQPSAPARRGRFPDWSESRAPDAPDASDRSAPQAGSTDPADGSAAFETYDRFAHSAARAHPQGVTPREEAPQAENLYWDYGKFR